MVWKLAETGKNQETIAGIMGWSRGQVSQYAMLKEIDTQVWHIIATTFAESGSSEKDDEVAGNATVVASPFGERILREIVALTAVQQLELVRLLVKDPKDKGEYKKKAEIYRARNALTEEARRPIIRQSSRNDLLVHFPIRHSLPNGNTAKLDVFSRPLCPTVATTNLSGARRIGQTSLNRMEILMG